MKHCLGLFMLTSLAIGVAQGAAISLVNTFTLGQTPPPGGPGPNAPLARTAFGGATTITALGVTFSFSSPSGTAFYGDTIGTSGNLIQPPFTDPLLDGPPDGTLTLTFLSPSTFLSFDVLLVPLGNSGGTVTMAGGPHTFSTTGGQGSGGLFSIGHFSFTPAAPFSQAVITFNPNTAGEFAIDNLSYDAPSTGSAVPEPATFTLLAAGILVAGALRIRRTSAR